MSKMTSPILGLFLLLTYACNNKSKTKENSDGRTYLVSMDGIDSLKLGMNKPELERVLGTKLTLHHIGKDYSPDTIPVKYQGMDMILYLEKAYDSITAIATLTDILTTASACKTENGLGVGSGKMNVIEGYPDNKKYVALEYETYPVRSTTRSAVAVMDSLQNKAIVFRIVDRKVVSVEVKSYYEFY